MFVSKGYKGIYDLYFKSPITGKRTKITTGKLTLWEAEYFKNNFHIDGYINSRIKRVTTLCELKNEFMSYARLHLAVKTVNMYATAISLLIQIVGNKPLALLSRKDIELFKFVRAKKVSGTSVNIQLRAIKSILKYAAEFNYIKINPSSEVRQLPINHREKLCFMDDQVKIILESISNNLLKSVVVFALLTGCRLNEILNVQNMDIDFKEMVLTIRNKPDFKIKNGRIRYIPISNQLNNLLKSILSHSESSLDLSQPESYIFVNSKGIKLNGNYVSKKFKNYLRQVGLPEKFHFHCLRHTFITNLIKKGVNINYAKQLAGHSEIKTTMGYVHIETEDLRKAVNLVNITF